MSLNNSMHEWIWKGCSGTRWLIDRTNVRTKYMYFFIIFMHHLSLRRRRGTDGQLDRDERYCWKVIFFYVLFICIKYAWTSHMTHSIWQILLTAQKIHLSVFYLRMFFKDELVLLENMFHNFALNYTEKKDY